MCNIYSVDFSASKGKYFSFQIILYCSNKYTIFSVFVVSEESKGEMDGFTTGYSYVLVQIYIEGYIKITIISAILLSLVRTRDPVLLAGTW